MENFRYSKELGGGALLDAGSYTLHISRKFFDREPEKIYSILRYQGEVDINGTVLLHYGKGCTSSLVFGFNYYYQNKYSVWGTEGKVTVTRAFSMPAEKTPKIILESDNSIENIECNADDQFINQIEQFCNGIENNELMHKWRKDALNQSKILDTIRRNSLRIIC